MKKFLVLSLILFSVICVKNTFASESSDYGVGPFIGSRYKSKDDKDNGISTTIWGERYNENTGKWNED